MRSILAALLLVVFPGVAFGQSALQPSYIRPAKGKAFSAFTSVTINGATSSTTSVYDMNGFSSVQLLLTSSAALAGCTHLPVITTQGAPNVTDTFTQAIVTDSNNAYTALPGATTTASYTVSGLPPYVRFVLTSTGAGGGTTCTLTVAVVPQPLSLALGAQGVHRDGETPGSTTFPVVIGGLDSNIAVQAIQTDTSGRLTIGGSAASGAAVAGNPVLVGGRADTTQPSSVSDGQAVEVWTTTKGAVVTAPTTTSTAIVLTGSPVSVTNAATQVFTADSTICSVTLQNVDTVLAYCGGTSSVTTTAYNWVLSVDTGSPAGAGGSITPPGYSGDIYCITAASTAKIAKTPIKCPGQ